jgi:GTPase SAR1 family protein
LRKHVDDDIVLAIVGNKCDLPSSFNFAIAESFAKDIGASVHQTSAQTGKGVTEMFETVSRALLNQYLESESKKKAQSTQASPSTINIDNLRTPATKQAGGCCK